MAILFSVALVVLTAALSLIFSSLTYSLRELSRPKLSERLTALGMQSWIERTLDHSGELTFTTAIGRLAANLFVFISCVHLLRTLGVNSEWMRFGLAILCSSFVTLFVSVAIPHAIAEHVGETFIAYSVRFLHVWRLMLLPMTHVMRVVDDIVRSLAGHPAEEEAEQRSEELEAEILSAVEEGEKDGVVDGQEREMIQSVIEFGDRTCGEAMTPRAKVIGLPVTASLDQVKSLFEESGHSRLPVYEGTLDKIVGIVYSRDLIKLLGTNTEQFETRKMMRSSIYVPDSKLLKDLLHDFRGQKTHIAIVLDEYGGTAGLVTIEDVLKELVGELADEHEPTEPSLLHRIDDHASEVDARMLVEQVNRLLSVSIPEDEGYETIGGFVSTTMGRIPEVGATFDFAGVKYTVTAAEPQRVMSVKVEKPMNSAATASEVVEAPIAVHHPPAPASTAEHAARPL